MSDTAGPPRIRSTMLRNIIVGVTTTVLNPNNLNQPKEENKNNQFTSGPGVNPNKLVGTGPPMAPQLPWGKTAQWNGTY